MAEYKAFRRTVREEVRIEGGRPVRHVSVVTEEMTGEEARRECDRVRREIEEAFSGLGSAPAGERGIVDRLFDALWGRGR